jgi:hypothetical protein
MAILLETLDRYNTVGWVPISDTWTYASADSPTFTFTITGDKTYYFRAGARIKLTQTTVKYFIVTAASYSAPDTTVTVYGGTDYTLANAAISETYYSVAKAPKGFPLDASKWTVAVASSTGSQASPTSGTYYNVGSNSIVIPIGLWHVSYSIVMWATRASTGLATCSCGLGTATNTLVASTASYLLGNYPVNPNSTPRVTIQWRSKAPFNLAAKTTYYLNAKVNAASHDPLSFGDTDPAGGIGIWAECAYL